jgi:hypothetical protein
LPPSLFQGARTREETELVAGDPFLFDLVVRRAGISIGVERLLRDGNVVGFASAWRWRR